MATQIFFVGLLIGGLTLATQGWFWQRGYEEWQTMVFTVLVVAQLFNCLAITITAQLAVIYVPVFAAVFRTVPLLAPQLGACFAIGSIVFIAIEAEKWVRTHS
jgi:Ca2+-transporting ATPase